MQYKDLKEMTIKEWDGQPFDAYVCDHDETNVGNPLITVKVYGYISNREYPWCCSDLNYRHAYPVEWNKEKVEEALNPKPKRMTKRQLAMWLAKGNGECSSCGLSNAYDNYHYQKGDENKLVGDGYKVRKWDSDEWVEPTVDLLEGV